MMLTGGKWGEASCAHCNRSLGAIITCPYCGFINAHVDSDGEALAEQEKQEPVAVISESAIGLVKLHSNGACLPFGTQLYAAPVSAKREWVDLTDYEIVRLYDESLMCNSEMIAFARAVIAAFKEKNK